MSLVLDASMTLAALFEDERTQPVQDLLVRVGEAGAVVPSLWFLEIVNGLHQAARRGRFGGDFIDQSLSDLTLLPLEIDQLTHDFAWGFTRTLARDERLTIYDAVYLELALRRSLPLATCDNALIEAARRRGVEVLTA